MRKGMLIAGIVVLVIGAAILGWGYSANTQSYSVSTGEGLQPTANTLGSDPITVSWSGGSSATTVTLYSSSASCSSTTVIASGSGASGSFTATIDSGSSDCLVVAGSSSAVSVTVAQHGFTYLELIGAIVLLLGVLIAAVGAVRKPKMRMEPVAYSTAEPAAPAAAAAGSDVYTAGPAAAAPSGAGRPPLICSHCGTSNEAWLTNCRNCKRPLATTAQ